MSGGPPMTSIDAHGIPEPLDGRFTELRPIGAGGSATVFRARDDQSGNEVAIKVLRQEASTTMGRARFEREMRAISEVQHPGVLPLIASGVIQQGDFQGCPYFVMPLIDGESLRDRLTRERQLSVAEATRIVLDILEALSAAHATGVIHRDIKPDNILLDGTRVLVADFGIARLTESGEGLLSSTGVVVGTPRYMSPEQVSGDRTLDHRSDIYSVGILFYELLAGEPPFAGPTVQAISARHLLEPPPPLGVVRPDAPHSLVAAIESALAKAPAARPRSADEFARAIRLAAAGGGPRVRGSSRRWAWAGGAMLLFATAATLIRWEQAAPGLSGNRLAVLPFVRTDQSAAAGIEDRVRSAVRRWSGLTVVDALEMTRVTEPVNDLATAAKRARAVGAGLAVVGRVELRAGTSVLSLSLVNVIGAPTVRRTIAVTLGEAAANQSLAVETATDSLLAPSSVSRITSRVYPAVLAFGEGAGALRAWDLEAAGRAFARATADDPSYAEARLWLALTRSWMQRPLSEWGYLVTREGDGDGALAHLDSARLAALRLQVGGDLAKACSVWESLTRMSPRDYALWYSLATCLRSDDLVVRTGQRSWRFRASRHAAVGAYRRALELLPTSHRALSDRSFETVRRLLLTSMTEYVVGRGPQGEAFAGMPALQSDTLVLVALPMKALMEGRADALPTTHRQAVMRQRHAFDSLATSWATAFPDSPAALLARAIAYEMTGDARMLSAVFAARTAARSAADSLLTASAQVRMLVKLGVQEPKWMDSARTMADALVDRYVSDTLADYGAAAMLAALTGRIHLAAQILRAKHARAGPSTPLDIEGRVLMLYAASGAYADSVQAIAARVQRYTEQLGPQEQAAFRMALIGRAATLAWPGAIPAAAVALRGQGDYLLDAQLQLATGDSAGAARVLADVVTRRTAPPADRTLDAVCPEALVMTRAGHLREGNDWLQGTLGALQVAPPSLFTDATSAAIIGRCLALGGSLAARAGDSVAAARLRESAKRLWASADAATQGMLARPMR